MCWRVRLAKTVIPTWIKPTVERGERGRREREGERERERVVVKNALNQILPIIDISAYWLASW